MPTCEEWQTTGTFNGKPFHAIHHCEDGARNWAESCRLVGTWTDGPHFHHRTVAEWQAVHDGGPRSHLGDLIVMHGPYRAGDLAPEPLLRLTSGAINELRDELIALRDIATGGEA